MSLLAGVLDNLGWIFLVLFVVWSWRQYKRGR